MRHRIERQRIDVAGNNRTAASRTASERDSRAWANGSTLAGRFMALFLSASLLLSLGNPALLRSPAKPLLDGSWSAAYQAEFDRNSPLLGLAATVWGVLDYTLFKQGRAGVLVGKDGWLFSSEEFVYPASRGSAEELLRENSEAVAAVRDRLADDGVQLVVALLPAKARLYPEKLGRYRLPAGPEARYRSSLESFRAESIVTADLLEPLQQAKEAQAVFLRTDSHWTPFGARTAAEQVAAAVAGLGPFDWLGRTPYSHERAPPQPHRGDLAGFLPLGPLYEAIGPADDQLASHGSKASDGPGTDLFASTALPVALVGTSYSQDERWNFAGSLRQALGTDVLVAARKGEGPFGPMIDYLQSEAYRLAKPEVVIWEIPERFLVRSWSAAREGP